MKAIDVSILVVSWNTSEILKNCLQSIYDQTKDISFEVIVVDNFSSDDSAKMVREYFPDVILIENGENYGFAKANNQGMAMAKGNYILLLNPDTVVLDGAIQKAFYYAEVHVEAAVVGCQVWLNEDEIQQTCFAFPSVWGILIMKLGLRRLFPQSHAFGWMDYGYWDRKSEKEVDVVSGMFMLVRKIAIDQIGVMDEDYFIYAEETDWCCRFQREGWKCIFTPTPRIIHLDGGNKSTDLVKTKMYVQMQKSVLIFMRKQKGPLSWSLVKGIYILSMLLRYVCNIGMSCLGNAKATRKVSQSSAALRFHIYGDEPE
jgi:GT2 family glycosyltransferase